MQSLRILFTGQNQVELVTEPLREPGMGEVVVQTSKTLISTGTEIICLSRLFEPSTHWDSWVRYPFSPGYSLAGQVIALGPGVSDMQVGERVAVRSPHQQYIVTPATRVLRIPADVSDEAATWFGLAGIVQNGVRRAKHELGETVVVIGLGLLGQLVVQYARLGGAQEVIAIDPVARRLAMAQAHGATVTLATDVESARSEVLRLTGGEGADVVYDVTGSARVFPHALTLLRQFGRLLLLGDTGTPSAQHLTSDVIRKGLQIIGAHDANPPAVSSVHARWSHPEMARLFFRYLQRGDMRVSDLITHRYAPTDAVEAYRMLREDRSVAMGVVFDWSQV